MPTKIEKDAVTGVETTGHEWDGLKELNNPLPKWWLYVLYATIAASVVYWILFPAWPTLGGYTRGLLGYDQREAVATDLANARAAQGAFRDRIAAASFAEIEADPELLNFAIAGGRVVFADNCATCHGAGGAGAAGYPALGDDEWLWGGTPEDIHRTLLYGVRWAHDETRISDMPRFGADGMMDRAQIADVTEHVLALSGQEADAAAAARGADLYRDNCAACHGTDGEGSRELGAPALSDAIWLYGGTREAIAAQIHAPKHGEMPAWAGRLDPVTLKQLTIYVHALGGGE